MSKNSTPQPDTNKAPILRLGSITQNQILFFIIWPFGQMINAVRHFRQPWSMAVLWLFCVYFGLVFVYGDPYGYGGGDSTSYALQLIEFHENQHSFDQLWASIYSVNTNRADLYQPLLTWLIALFTGNPAFLFAAFAAVFGFFYVKNLWMIFTRISASVGVILFLFMLSYALVNPLWNINGVRMWTAAQVFLYGNLLYFLYDNKRGLWWSAVSILFHFSFVFPVALLFAWLFIPRNAGLLFGFYIATSFIKEIDLFEVRSMLSFLPDFLQPRVVGYTSEVYAEGLATRTFAFHEALAINAGRWVTYAWIIFAFIKRQEWMNSHKTYGHIFMFALFLGGFANIASNVPSGGRFVVLSNSLFYALFVLLLGKNYLRLYWLKLITVPLLALSIVFKIRMSFDYIGFLTVAGNPLLAPFFGEQTPLIDFVKDIF
jgi:hypothetical protein